MDEQTERTGAAFSAAMRRRLVETNVLQLAVQDRLVPAIDDIPFHVDGDPAMHLVRRRLARAHTTVSRAL